MKARLPLLFAVLVLALVLIALACGPSARFTDATPESGHARMVTSTETYVTLDLVPRPLTDLVLPGTLPGPVYFAVADGAYCAVPVATFIGRVTVGSLFTCPWRWPRGV